MAIRGRSDLQDAIKRALGERTDDDAIQLLEDVADTLDDYDARVGEDWRAKYEQNDADWRKRYTDRFNGTSPDEDLEGGEIEHIEVSSVEEDTTTTWDDLFE